MENNLTVAQGIALAFWMAWSIVVGLTVIKGEDWQTIAGIIGIGLFLIGLVYLGKAL